MATVRRIKLGSQGLEVSAQGLGCFGMTGGYGPPMPEPDLIGLIHGAVESGITLFDTADVYGHFANEVLLGKLKTNKNRSLVVKGCRRMAHAPPEDGNNGRRGRLADTRESSQLFVLEFQRISNMILFADCLSTSLTKLDTTEVQALKGGWRERVELATKFGIIYENRRAEMRGDLEVRGDPAYVRAACEASLKRLDAHCIDLYYQHRIDTRVPIEIVMGELKKLVEEGKIKELGIGIVAYSPLGQGFFGSGAKMAENLANDDLRKRLPRFQLENIEHNKTVFEWVNEMAARKGCTPAQLALAWVHHQGYDVCPIPGTTKIENLKQNIGALCVKLTPEEMAKLERFADAVKGDRCWVQAPTWKNSDTPPLLSSWKSDQ
ncbi:hypothetical protein RHMOL_Rhmol02G0078400 [Rhododendron molle]|uniref:Uncharacterized protein n=1 Tax=Rhododendron molle TaxID=49168 RepID=A0ACC0PMI5_RHOML|nr:hypothetical protein RHMOL_Rhmol02G0078400 [Rhododendron molle]